MSVTIRRATDADAAVLAAFMREMAAETHPDDRAAAADAVARALVSTLEQAGGLASPWFTVLLAIDDHNVGGYATLVRIPKLHINRGALYVDELYVLEAHRRRGIARALIGEAERLARELGMARVRLIVRPGNAAARALYDGLGYKPAALDMIEKPLAETRRRTGPVKTG
jgi:ribosomal protein S18 acetylase RimI-like enzyme